MFKTYSELRKLNTFEDRFEYLKLTGEVGASTFGFDRYINQQFYASREWKQSRYGVIFRDKGCDLGIPGYEIERDILIHHMNPVSLENIVHGDEWIFDPEFLITTTKRTHNAIHFGNESLLPKTVLSRVPNDTSLW